MEIGGPFFNAQRRGSPKKWYLSYFVPKLNADGRPLLNERGRPILQRRRPYYESRDAAQADKPRILAQHHSGGTTEGGILSRDQVSEFTAAKRIVAEVSLVEIATFWRLHHPLEEVSRVEALQPEFVAWSQARLGDSRSIGDLRSRTLAFARAFTGRIPTTISRQEVMAYLFGLGLEGRTVLNHKRAICTFFNYLISERGLKMVNPAGGIKKRQLPKATVREIEYLSLPYVLAYLRAMERYDPELIAHEVIQLFSGVRADDEMDEFDGAWVLPATKEILIPNDVAKTERREVLSGLEDNFWEWWAAHGRRGKLRPRNYTYRWHRIRVLATVVDRARADTLAALPIKTLLGEAVARQALQRWPFNARRRSFCSYHVAKYQSAARTALILRHRGDPETLHNSYRGTGVTQAQGDAFFALRPEASPVVISPVVVLRGAAARGRGQAQQGPLPSRVGAGGGGQG